MSFRNRSPRAPAREPSRGGRPRDASREAAILTAAIDIVSEVGYERTTIEAVARRSGTSKATIYRRWSGKRDLVVAAVTAHQGGEFPAIDTGSLRGDLLALARRLIATLTSSHGSLVLTLLQETANDPELCELIEDGAGQTGARLPAAVLDRAVARGELPDGAVSYPYDEVVGSVLILRALMGYPMDEAYLTHLIDAIVLPTLRTATGPAPGPALFADRNPPTERPQENDA